MQSIEMFRIFGQILLRNEEFILSKATADFCIINEFLKALGLTYSVIGYVDIILDDALDYIRFLIRPLPVPLFTPRLKWRNCPISTVSNPPFYQTQTGFLPPAYGVRREGYVLTRVCLSVTGGCQVQPGGVKSSRGVRSSRGGVRSIWRQGGVSRGGSAKIGQHSEYLLHGGQCASCVHAGGLSC